MGWSTWSYLRKHPTATAVMAEARALKTSGLAEAGYIYVNLDDFWYECPGPQGPNVTKYGLWKVNAKQFPKAGELNGIEGLAHYVHSRGLKFGIYETPGISEQAVKKDTMIRGTRYRARDIALQSVHEYNYNCGGMVGINFSKPGSQAYIDSIVKRFASWGVDFIKLDGVTNANAKGIRAWSVAIQRSGRPMVLDVTDGTFTKAIRFILERYANEWEPAPDVECYACETGGSSFPLTSWSNVRDRFGFAAGWQNLVTPGHFNDFDSIDIGNGNDDGLTVNERKSVLSLWALGASPLILGSDVTHLNSVDKVLLENRSVIALDQDSVAAKRVVWSGPIQAFMKVAPSGDVFFGLFNMTSSAVQSDVLGQILGLPVDGAEYRLQNLWTHQWVVMPGPYIRVNVPAHGVGLFEWVPDKR